MLPSTPKIKKKTLNSFKALVLGCFFASIIFIYRGNKSNILHWVSSRIAEFRFTRTNGGGVDFGSVFVKKKRYSFFESLSVMHHFNQCFGRICVRNVGHQALNRQRLGRIDKVKSYFYFSVAPAVFPRGTPGKGSYRVGFILALL